jgi:hypothetical protein
MVADVSHADLSPAPVGGSVPSQLLRPQPQAEVGCAQGRVVAADGRADKAVDVVGVEDQPLERDAEDVERQQLDLAPEKQLWRSSAWQEAPAW